MGKSQNCSSAGNPVDRISNLPDSLICCILSFLQTKFAVATSILSRRWKFLWKGVTALDFDDHGEKTEGGGEGITRMSFAQFVSKVLLYMDAKHLNKFRLRGMKNCNADYFTMWVSFAISRNVKFLTLHMCPRDILPGNGGFTAYFELPDSLFTCGTLEFLSLEGHILVKVPSSVCLPKLEVLKLCLVSYGGDEPFEKLISGCPVLHSLKLSRIFFEEIVGYRISSPSLKCLEIFTNGSPPLNLPLEIDAPAVEFFVLEDPMWQGCSVKRLSSVRRAVLDIDCSLYPNAWGSAVDLLGALNRVNHLTLKGTVLMSLSNATIPFSAIFERLTELDIECSRLLRFPWSSLNVMLCCSIKLQVLSIKGSGRDPGKDPEGVPECLLSSLERVSLRRLITLADRIKMVGIGRGPWKDPEGVPECLISSLERVSFRGYRNLGEGIKMVEYILKHGALLKLFHFEYPGNCHEMNDLKRKLRMLQEISMLPRYSRACRIQFD